MTTWAQDAADALDALGDTPTPDEARTVTDRYPNVDVLAAIASRGGGGITPVSVYLRASNLDVHDAGPHVVLWDEMFDTVRGPEEFPQTILDEIPEGLGLTFSFDGTGDGRIEPTEPGVWAFTFACDLQDALDGSFRGYVSDDIMGEDGFHEGGAGGGVATNTNAAFSSIYRLPFWGGGAGPAFTVQTVVAATEDPFLVDCLLSIVRLG